MENNFSTTQVLQRYNLTTNKDILYSYEELRRLNIDQDFIYTLLQTFEDENAFSAKAFDAFSFEVIIDYIHRTHTYYLSKKLPEIEQSIHILLKDYESNHPLLQILNTFFKSYTAKLTSHIHAEEKRLIPYIHSLITFDKEGSEGDKFFAVTHNYSLQHFIHSHDDTEEDLANIRDTILEYKAPVTNQTPYRILLSQLDTFEKDLKLHALIEDEVLIPRALLLEEKVNKKFS